MVSKLRIVPHHQEHLHPDHTEVTSLSQRLKTLEGPQPNLEFTVPTDPKHLKELPGRQAQVLGWEVKMEGVKQ